MSDPRRVLSAVERAHLLALAREARTPGPVGMEARHNATQFMRTLHDEGVVWRDLAGAAAITTTTLRRWRRAFLPKPTPPARLTTVDGSERMLRVTFEIEVDAQVGALSLSADLFESQQSSLLGSTDVMSSSFTLLRRSPTNQVVIALGFNGRHNRYDLNREAQVIRSQLDGVTVPRAVPNTTPEVLQAEAATEPLLLHIAFHRDLGTSLVDEDGQELLLPDEGLLECLAPQEGGPRAVVLSGCDSVELAQPLVDRGVQTVVSFDGVITGTDLAAFHRMFYGKMGQRQSMPEAFEHAEAAMRIRGATFVPRIDRAPGADRVRL